MTSGRRFRGGYSDNSEENEPGNVEPGNVEPGENEPGNVEPGKDDPGKNDPGESKPGEENPVDPGENAPVEDEPGEENPDEILLEEEILSLYNNGTDSSHIFDDIEAEKGKATLVGIPVPEGAVCLRKGKESDIGKNDGAFDACAFFKSQSKDGSDPVCLEEMIGPKESDRGSGYFYDIKEEDHGWYIFARYRVEKETSSETEKEYYFYYTESVPVGYREGEDDEIAEENGVILQMSIDKWTEISESEKEVEDRYIPEEIHIKADEIKISDGVRLKAWGVSFEGSIKTIKTESDIGDAVEINGLTITNNGGTAIDASEVPVRLNDCTFNLTNANLLQVSDETYKATELNGCSAEFTSGGSILKLTGETASMGEFSLENTDLNVSISGNNTVTMLEASGNAKWNVEGLRPDSRDTLAKLSFGTDGVNVINSAFYIDGENGMISSTNVLTMKTSVHDKWISRVTADGKTFGDEGAKIIVSPPKMDTYEVWKVLGSEDEDYQFRPYAVTGQDGSGTGDYDYSMLRPSGCLSYLVIDLTKKGGFPYGAQIAREWTLSLPKDKKDFVVLQYHADKSVEAVCSVTGDEEPVIKGDSILAELSDMGNGNYRAVVNTMVKGENVEEPIVLAVYSELPAAQTKFAVYEYERTDDEGEEVRVPSDGKILTDGEKTVSLELNGGIGTNHYSGIAFVLDQTKCTVPKDSEITLQPDNDNNQMAAELKIPAGTSGTLTITPHYKSSATAAEAKLASYTLQLTNIQNIKGIKVDSSAAGSKYYGTATFDILSGDAKAFLGVSARNGEDTNYNLKVTSSSKSGNTVTVQYVLDLRYDGRPDGGEKTEDSAWESFCNNPPPCLVVETTAGEWEIDLDNDKTELSVTDNERGVRYLFVLEGENAVYTGARIIDGEAFYRDGARLEIPGEVTVGEKKYSVTAMAKGCLNNFYENGVKVNAPEIVVIPVSVTDIREKLITDKNSSDLWQIVVATGNTVYCTYGSADDFDKDERDDSQYCALYKKAGNKTELVEIASAYNGKLAWRNDAEWTDKTYDLDFSDIYGFWCEDDENAKYQTKDGLLVEKTGDGCVVVKGPGRWWTDLLIPEGITGMKARALENLDITTLVLPATMSADGAWEKGDKGAVTNAKSIYVYSKENNPVMNLADTVKGVTFYGFVDKDKNSALKTWAGGNAKSRGYKFTAMEESGTAADYTLKTLREAAKTSDGKEYYEVRVGEELTETFDFDIASTVKNGYPGKTELTVEVKTENGDYTAQSGEFAEEPNWYGGKFFRAENPGVAEVVFKNGEKVVKTVYFAVRPDGFDITRGDEDYLEIPLGEVKEIKAEAYVYVWGADEEGTDDEEANLPTRVNVSEEALQEYEQLGVLRSVIPDERKVSYNNKEYDAWKIERKANEFAYNVTPLLYLEKGDSKKGDTIKGGSGSEFILELFGERRSVWVETYAAEDSENDSWLVPDNYEWNPLLKKNDVKEIPVMEWKGAPDVAVDESESGPTGTPIDFSGELSTLQFKDGKPAYDGEFSYQRVACEVISGSQFVDAAIVKDSDGKASVKLTAKKEGKAEVRVFRPYSRQYWKSMYLTVSVGNDLVEIFQLTLWKDNENDGENEGENKGKTLLSSVYEDEEQYRDDFDVNEKTWKEWDKIIPVRDIEYLDSKTKSMEPLPSSKLEWKISDPNVAKLVKGDTNDKNKVTGIKLEKEGTVLVSASVKDTNKATINMVFTVWDGKPGFYNSSDSLDAYKIEDCAEYSLAVKEGVTVTDVTLKEAKQGKTDVSGYFAKPVIEGKKIRISLNEGQPAAIPTKATTYTLTLSVTTAYTADGEAEEETVEGTEKVYEYPVTLTMGGPKPKATVSASALDISIPSKCTSTLTVKMGDVTNSGMTLTLDDTDPKDTVTKSFKEYFTLDSKEDGSYTVSLKDAKGNTAAKIVNLFNNKKIKLTVTSEDYKAGTYEQKAEVLFKMSATVPVLKPAGNGKVTINTGDVTAYEGDKCKASFAYTLTDGFKLGKDADGKIDMTIAPKQSVYKDSFAFTEEDDQIVVTADPGLPKGAYTFTWTPEVLATGEQNDLPEAFFTQTLKAPQTITVTIAKSSAKISLSSTKLNLNSNYINTDAQTWLQFDESQIRTLCGNDRWCEGYDEEKTNASITLVKAPKGVDLENPSLDVRMQDNWFAASVKDKSAQTGEYKYEIVPYVRVNAEWIESGEEGEEGYWEFISMPLAPLTLSVQVTNALPKASLTQTTITIDNNDMSARAFTRWNINGNYEYIDCGQESNYDSDSDDSESNGQGQRIKLEDVKGGGNIDTQPEISLEGNEIRVSPRENTIKGTYKYQIKPKVVLDSENESVKNSAELAPVTLTVNVPSTRPALKLAKSSLTVYNQYPGGEDEDSYYAPVEAGTDVDTSNGYTVGYIRIEPADKTTEGIDKKEEQKIELSVGYDGDPTEVNGEYIGRIRCFDAIPKTGTPAGTYKYRVYANLYAEDEEGNPIKGAALEPVTLTVFVKKDNPKLNLSAGSVTLPAGDGREGSARLTLLDPAECVKYVEEKTEYLCKDASGKWKLTDEEPGEGSVIYAQVDTADDGTVTVTKQEGATTAAEVKKIAYSQKVYLKGRGDETYTANHTLNFSFKTGKAVAVLSQTAITLNKNYDLWRQQEGNELKLSLNTGEDVSCDIEDLNTGNKKGAIDLDEIENRDGRERLFEIVYKNSVNRIETGSYSFRITPEANREKLAPVTVTVTITDTLPTVTASRNKVTVNKLDTRGNTWQFIHFKPNSSSAEVYYKWAVTKGPKDANLSEINFFPDGWWNMHNEADLIIGSTDTEIPDGAYTVRVTPYTWKADGKRADLKPIDITVTVNSPKVTAALRTPKMTIDVAAENSVDMRNSIVLTGTNADLVEKVFWKDWKLTKKPKGAGDWDIWIEDLYADDGPPENIGEDGVYEHDGKEFSVCWGEYNDYGPRQINIIPGTYEFTLTPAAIRSCEGVDIPVPAAVKLTVTVKNTKPTVKYSKTSSKMNLFFTSEDRIYYTLSDPSWWLSDVDAVMTSWPKDVGEEKSALRIDHEGDRLTIRGTDKVPEGTYTFLLEARAEKNGMEALLNVQKYTVTVKNELPTVKAAAGKLTCNALYSGSYRLEDNPEDNFNKKQQTKLTLTKNYGFSYFEGCEIEFTGNQNLKYDAAKIGWGLYEDGTIAAILPWGSVVAAGSYPFEITPIIRGDETGKQMTLKPVKLTVAVENKKLSASAKASGKIDLLNREGSGITYKVTLADKDADAVREIWLEGPEKGNDESWKFDLEQDPENPAECTIRAKDWQELSTKTKYNMRLKVITEYGKECYVPITIQPTQSKLTLSTDVTAVTLFKQDYETGYEDENGEWIQEFTGPAVEIKASINNTEVGEIIIEDGLEDLWTGNRDFRAWIVQEEGSGEGPGEGSEPNILKKSVTVRIAFASKMAEAKYKDGASVDLPIYVDVFNQASETYNTTKVTVKVNIKN